MAGVISKLVSFFDLSRGLNALGVYKNLSTGGQPDSKLFQDLLATTFLKKYDNTDFQDVATFQDLIDRLENKVFTPENQPLFIGDGIGITEPTAENPYYTYNIEGGGKLIKEFIDVFGGGSYIGNIYSATQVNTYYRMNTLPNGEVGIPTIVLPTSPDDGDWVAVNDFTGDGFQVYNYTPPLGEPSYFGGSTIQGKTTAYFHYINDVWKLAFLVGADIDISGKADITYVDAQDTATLNSAKAYADGLVVGLWDDRGNYDASVNAFPTSGGSGTGGAIKKGDTWTVSVAGTLPTSQNVEVGDIVRALIDSPGSTQSNWAIQQNNIGYVAENSNNKTNTVAGNEASTTLYASVKGFVDYLVGMAWLTNSIFGTWINAQSAKTTLVDADTTLTSDSKDSNKSKKVSWLNVWNYIKGKTDSIYLALSGGKLTGALNEADIATVASASTVNLTSVTANTIIITGNTTINQITGIPNGGTRLFIFTGTPTIVFNASYILTPNNTNLVVASGDVIEILSTVTSGAVKITNYFPLADVFLKDGTTGGYYSNYALNIGGFIDRTIPYLIGQTNIGVAIGLTRKPSVATTAGRTLIKINGLNTSSSLGVSLQLNDSAYSSNPNFFNIWNCDGGGVVIGGNNTGESIGSVNQTLQVFKGGVKISDNSAVGASVTAPSRAVIQFDSTSRGVLLPRLTTTQRNAVSWVSGDAGMMQYNSTQNWLEIYNATAWKPLTDFQSFCTIDRSVFATATMNQNIYGFRCLQPYNIGLVNTFKIYVGSFSASEVVYVDIYNIAQSRIGGASVTLIATGEVTLTVSTPFSLPSGEYWFTMRSTSTAQLGYRSATSNNVYNFVTSSTYGTGASPSTIPANTSAVICPMITIN